MAMPEISPATSWKSAVPELGELTETSPGIRRSFFL